MNNNSTKSLLTAVSKNIEFKMYFSNNDKLFAVTLTNETLTIKDAILEST